MGEARGIYQRGDTKCIQNFGQKVCYFSTNSPLNIVVNLLWQ